MIKDRRGRFEPSAWTETAEISLRANRQPFRRVADRDVVDDPRRVGGEIDDADRIDIPVRGAAIAVIRGQGQLAVG